MRLPTSDFDSKWRELFGFFGADQIASKMVAPLPYLVVPAFPLRLNNELVLDRLTDDEVTRCYQVGVIQACFAAISAYRRRGRRGNSEDVVPAETDPAR